MCTHTSSATSLQKWRSCPCLGAGGHSRGGLAGEPASVALDIYVDCHFSVFVDKWPIIPWHQLFSISSSVPELRQNYRVSCKILNTEQQTGWRHLHYKYSCTVGISVLWVFQPLPQFWMWVLPSVLSWSYGHGGLSHGHMGIHKGSGEWMWHLFDYAWNFFI